MICNWRMKRGIDVLVRAYRVDIHSPLKTKEREYPAFHALESQRYVDGVLASQNIYLLYADHMNLSSTISIAPRERTSTRTIQSTIHAVSGHRATFHSYDDAAPMILSHSQLPSFYPQPCRC